MRQLSGLVGGWHGTGGLGFVPTHSLNAPDPHAGHGRRREWPRTTGRKRRGRYIFEWWISDHPPRHLHVYDSRGEFLGRVVLVPEVRGLRRWKPPRAVLALVREMMAAGDLGNL